MDDIDVGHRSVDRIGKLFLASRFALVGASDESGWTRQVVHNLTVLDTETHIVPVHPKRASVLGRTPVRNLRELDEPVDVAFVMTPPSAVEEVLRDTAAAGIGSAIVLASGYGEAGEAGKHLETRMAHLSEELDITVLGPNTLGYVNSRDQIAPFGGVIAGRLRSGPVGLISQSGALCGSFLRFAQSCSIGMSLLVAMGNETVVSSTDVMRYLIADDSTRVIAMFVESFRDPDAFLRAAADASRAGKPVVVLKVGRTDTGQRAAMAHTGAITGDAQVVSSVLREAGVIQVNSIEELLITSGAMGYVQPLPTGNRLGVVTSSGGVCDVVADRADDEGVDIPDFSPDTVSALEAIIPPFASAVNPLDVTAYEMAGSRAKPTNPVDDSLEIVMHDPDLDLVYMMWRSVPPLPPPDPARIEARMAAIADSVRRSPVPVFLVETTSTDTGPYRDDLYARHGLHVISGLDMGMTVIGHCLRWAKRKPARYPSPPHAAVPMEQVEGPGMWPENVARDFVSSFGVPVVPGKLVQSEQEAVAAARELGMPVAMKICSGDIAHKSDIGGVVLDVASAEQAVAGYRRVMSAGAALPEARIAGVLVTPMREHGLELLAAVSMDATFGLVLTVAIGGIFIEVLNDASVRPLPVSPDDVREMLSELRGAPLLRGVRGSTPISEPEVVQAILGICAAAAAAGPGLDTLEVNPLWVSGDQVEALDVLITIQDKS